LEKGDARFDIEKEILGFMINGATRTLRLSETKAQSIAKEITNMLRKTNVPLKRFRSLLSRLQHAARILPAAKGLFSPSNKAMKGDPKQVGVKQAGNVQPALLNFRHLMLALASRPTDVSKLAECDPEMAGSCDTSAAGAGGVWVVSCGVQPTVWRVEWLHKVVQPHRSDKLTNSVLEMAAMLLQCLAAEQSRPMGGCHTAIWSDNSPATSWSTKMANKAATPIASGVGHASTHNQAGAPHSGPLCRHTQPVGRCCVSIFYKVSPR
jgi:hypothetical protein